MNVQRKNAQGNNRRLSVINFAIELIDKRTINIDFDKNVIDNAVFTALDESGAFEHASTVEAVNISMFSHFIDGVITDTLNQIRSMTQFSIMLKHLVQVQCVKASDKNVNIHLIVSQVMKSIKKDCISKQIAMDYEGLLYSAMNHPNVYSKMINRCIKNAPFNQEKVHAGAKRKQSQLNNGSNESAAKRKLF